MSASRRKFQWSESGAGGSGSGHTHVPQSATLTRDVNGAVKTVTSIGIDLVEGDTWSLSRNLNESIASLTNAGTDGPPSDWLIKWDATTSAGIGYLTDEATNDVDSWECQEGAEELGTLTLLDQSVGLYYPEYVTDADGLPCVHMQDDGALLVWDIATKNPSLSARIEDAADVTVFVVAKHLDPANETAINAYCYAGCNGHRVGTVGLDTSLDSYVGGQWTAAANPFDDRRFIASFRNKHNGTDDNDGDQWIGKTNIWSVNGWSDASFTAPSSFISIGSYSTASSVVWDTDCNIYEVLIYGRSLTDEEHANVVDSLSYKWQATNADNAVDTISEAPPGPYYLVTVDRDVDGIIEGVTTTVV